MADKNHIIQSVPLDPLTHQTVKTLAAQQERPIASMLRILIKEALKARGQK